MPRPFRLALCLLCLPAISGAQTILDDDFKRGVANWEMTDPNAWRITELEDGNRVLEIFEKSDYTPPHRSPYNMALFKYASMSDFELKAKVQTLQSSRGHRDMCVFFGYQDPAHFYYVHLGQETDDHANQIFIVNGADRIKISEKTTEGTPWVDGKWHSVKVVREVESGLIEIYFDDMEEPAMVAHDKTFASGQIGLGTFDDKGYWDDVELTGTKVGGAMGAADPATLKFEKWTPFDVPDPVAISFDDRIPGVAYVTQTTRRKANDLDIRQNADWIPNDLSFQSVAEKLAFFEAQFTPENSEANKKRVKDLNGDGSHDLADLTVLSEKVWRIVDKDLDGKADEITGFAEEFNTPVTGIAAGVLHHEGRVYATVAPDVWAMEDTDGDGVADAREVIAHGFGMHIAYGGHDMHGLTVGPDGRIYWSIGDKGVNVKSKEGEEFFYPNQGAVMRCEPDGSNFEVFAHGLRNVQEPKFDKHGNLFGVDNDADFSGEMERFIYIVEGMDAGWRANWQYRGEGYNPWMAERIWEPWNESTPAHIVPPIVNYQNGPAGFIYNPGTALSPEWEDYFFLNSAPNGQQYAFRAEEDGASFRMTDETRVGNGIPLVGSAWGMDGAWYSVDWGGGYPLNEKGAVYKIDVPEYAGSAARKETSEFLSAETLENPTELLRHADMRVRLRAQFQIAKAGDPQPFLEVMKGDDEIAAIHAVWGYGQIERAKGQPKVAPLLAIATDESAHSELRVQAVKTIGSDFPGSDRGALAKLLSDENPRLQMQAGLAIKRHGGDGSDLKAVIDFLAKLKPEDTYLRHAGAMALVGMHDDEMAVAALSVHESETVRLAAVAALREVRHPGVAEFLGDKSARVAIGAASAIHDDWMIEAAMPALAAAIGAREDEAFVRRAINANFRIGDEASAARVAAFAADSAKPEGLRVDALDALKHWTKPAVLDRVVGRYRELEARDPQIASAALSKLMGDLLVDDNPKIQAQTMELASALKVEIKSDDLIELAKRADSPVELRVEAIRSLGSQKVDNLQGTLGELVKDSSSVEVRAEALDVLATISESIAVAHIEGVLEHSSDLEEKQRAIGTLANTKGDGAADLLKKLDIDEVPAGLKLDVALAQKMPPMEIPMEYAKEGGNAKRGASIVANHLAAQCMACHKVADGKGSSIGPNLKSIGAKKDRDYIFQSLVEPQAEIASGYGMISLTLKDGSTAAGQFRSDKDGKVVLRDPAGKETKIASKDIESRTDVISTMPPMGVLLQRSELRDVVEYLTTLRAE